MSLKVCLFLGIVIVLVVSGCSTHVAVELMGAYEFPDGELVSIRRSRDDALRYRVYATGASGKLFRGADGHYVSGPGFSSQSPVELTVRFLTDAAGRADSLVWEEADRPPRTARRVGEEQWVQFRNGGTLFSGRLDLPDGSGPHPAVVLVHGSGDAVATQWFSNGDFLSANGIAVLTFDKRGTGGSGGSFTFDFEQLGRDVVAAVGFLAEHPRIDPDRIGLCGYSQGTWVGPLAASKSEDIRFLVLSYGLIGSPAEEARVETRNLLRKRGVGEEHLDDADELTLAAVRVVATDFKEGWDELDALKKMTEDSPWRKQLSGTTVQKFVKYPKWLLKLLGPGQAPDGLPWYYDSMEVLRSLDIPMVWLLAQEDESAPVELTLPALEQLRAEGKPYESVVFTGADHTMLLFREEEGRRIYTGYAPDYFKTEVEAVRRLAGVE